MLQYNLDISHKDFDKVFQDTKKKDLEIADYSQKNKILISEKLQIIEEAYGIKSKLDISALKIGELQNEVGLLQDALKTMRDQNNEDLKLNEEKEKLAYLRESAQIEEKLNLTKSFLNEKCHLSKSNETLEEKLEELQLKKDLLDKEFNLVKGERDKLICIINDGQLVVRTKDSKIDQLKEMLTEAESKVESYLQLKMKFGLVEEVNELLKNSFTELKGLKSSILPASSIKDYLKKYVYQIKENEALREKISSLQVELDQTNNSLLESEGYIIELKKSSLDMYNKLRIEEEGSKIILEQVKE